MQKTENNIEMSGSSVSFSVLCDHANIRKCCFKLHGDVYDFFLLLDKPINPMTCKAEQHTPVWAPGSRSGERLAFC